MAKIHCADRAAGPGAKAMNWASAVVERVIRVRFARGSGTADNPLRTVDAWFSLEGELLAEHDPEVRS